jgi:phage recombination protein Bet
MNDLVKFQPPRLPYHPVMEERFGVSAVQWKALVEAVFPSAKTPDAVVMALAYCQARNLDPFKKPVHIVPVWDSTRGAMVETVWPGISELRTTAMRTKQYAGCDEVEFGPDLERHYEWTDKKGAKHEADVQYPEWARMTVYRLLHAERIAIVGPKVYWMETYARVGKSEAPNDMWRQRPRGQLEKCAEAAALRRAFPEELGDEPTAEEMEGRTVAYAATDAPAPLAITEGFDPKPKPPRSPRKPRDAQTSDRTAEPEEGLHASQEAEDEGISPEPAVDAEFEEVERPTETVSAQPAEAERDTSETATPASDDGAETSDSGPSPEVDDGAAASAARPARDEVYIWSADAGVGDDGRIPTYKNGRPWSRWREGSKVQKPTVYDLHPREEAEPLPPTSSDSSGSDEAEFEEQTDDHPIADVLAKIAQAPNFLAGKQAMKTFIAGEFYKSADEAPRKAMGERLRSALWDRYAELVANEIESEDVTTDLTLMRIFLEFGAQTEADLNEYWPRFWRSTYKGLGEKEQRGIMDVWNAAKTRVGKG